MSIKSDSKDRFDIGTITNNFSIEDAQNLCFKESGFEQKISVKKSAVDSVMLISLFNLLIIHKSYDFIQQAQKFVRQKLISLNL